LIILPNKSPTTKKEVCMSKKRMMPRSVRIYYEQQKKERVNKELLEYARILREMEKMKDSIYRGKDH
jgi:hypothetical protein